MSERPILLQADHLKKWFPVRKGVFSKAAQYVKAVDDVSLVIREGETLGIVGESGCGKSTLARTMMRLIEPTEGTVLFQGQDLTSADKESLRRMRRDIQIIFQDPYASLNPRQRVSDILAEPFLIHKLGSREAAMKRAEELLDLVGLSQDSMRKFPHEFSGGQRQRLCIARALSVSPKLIVCDECVSALDVSIQAQVLNLMLDIQEKFGLTYIFITHDLGVVASIADKVAVMYAGEIIEYATVEEIFYEPCHPYTWSLLSSLPQLADDNGKLFSIPGTPPSLYTPVVGDAFALRSDYAMQIDFEEKAPQFQVSDTHWAKTWLLHEDAPKVDKPAVIQNLHEKIRANMGFAHLGDEEEGNA